MHASAGTLRLLALFFAGFGLASGLAKAGPTYAIADLGTGILPTGMGPTGILFGEAAGTAVSRFGGGKSSVPGLSMGTSIVGINGQRPDRRRSSQWRCVFRLEASVDRPRDARRRSQQRHGIECLGNRRRQRAGRRSGITSAFLYDGTMRALGTLGGASSYAASINTSCQVVGGAQTAGGAQHAFPIQNGQMTDLGTLGGPTSGASAINDAGQIAGSSKSASGIFHAFLVSSGAMTDLGSLGNASYAFGMNSRARSSARRTFQGPTSTFTNHAFLATTAGMLDLNTLVPGLPSGWVLTTATGIGDSGEIVGYGYLERRPPRLSPLADLLGDRPRARDPGDLRRRRRDRPRAEGMEAASGLGLIRILLMSHGFQTPHSRFQNVNSQGFGIWNVESGMRWLVLGSASVVARFRSGRPDPGIRRRDSPRCVGVDPPV